jgi:hypothetical protein
MPIKKYKLNKTTKNYKKTNSRLTKRQRRLRSMKQKKSNSKSNKYYKYGKYGKYGKSNKNLAGGFSSSCNMATVKEPGFIVDKLGSINGLSIPSMSAAIYRPNCQQDTYQAMTP